MKMRDYVDGIQGAGSWDRMHDLIEKKQLFGWTLPPVEVDGREVHIFPGEDREVTLEDVQDEIRRAFAQVGSLGDGGRVYTFDEIEAERARRQGAVH